MTADPSPLEVELDPTPQPGQTSLLPCEPDRCDWLPEYHELGRTRWTCGQCGAVESTSDARDPYGVSHALP